MTDNSKHIVISAGIAFTLSIINRLIGLNPCSIILAGIITLGIGVAKEYYDQNYDTIHEGNKWSWKDIEADAIGMIIGCAVGLLLWII